MTKTNNEHQNERYTKKVADLLIYTRRKANLSARELARRVGTSHSTILSYESRKKVPMVTTMMRIVHACGYSLDFELAPRMRGKSEYTRGNELLDVLELASVFPTNHSIDSAKN
jgi:transcriptional regulator with XRE-family HTH domain